MIRRLLLVAVGLLAGAALLIALAVGFTESMIFLTGALDLHHALGIDTQASQNYDFTSGSGPMIVSAIGFSGAGLSYWRHVNCHTDGCPRIGRYPVEGTPYKVCKACHPTVPDQVTVEHLRGPS